MAGLQSVLIGAGTAGSNAAYRTTIMGVNNKDNTQQGGELIDVSGQSDAARINDQILDFVESDEFNHGVTAVTGMAVTVQGGMAASAAGTSVAAGAGTAFGVFAVGVAAGMAGGCAGSYVGDKLGHAAVAVADFLGLADDWGLNKVATEGENPARLGDDIAHQKKDWGLWGAIGGIIAGAVVATAIIMTGGAALVVVVGCAAAAGGFVGGVIAGAGNALGQYGENKGKIIEGSPNVYFNNRPVARAGDKIKCGDHPDEPSPVIAEGAKTVFANNKPVARLGHQSTCDGNINSASGNIVETKETGRIYKVIDSRNPVLRWAVPVTAVVSAVVSGKVTQSAKGKNNNAKNSPQKSDPVDITTGDYFQQWPVIDIPGVLPLTLARLYRSNNTFDITGAMGKKWANTWSQHLTLHDDSIEYTNEEGVVLSYLAPENEVFASNLREKRYVLKGQRQGTLWLFDYQKQQLITFGYTYSDKRLISKIEDRQGNAITFYYDDGRLTKISHSDGYYLDIHSDQHGIRDVDLNANNFHQRLLTCQYDDNGYLISCHSFQFGHVFHEYNMQGCMTRWRDTDATDVTMRYDPQGRVISLGSKEGYFNDRFVYYPEIRKTVYYDAEGGISTSYYNEHNLVVKEIDALGGVTLYEWDVTNKVAVTDASGRTTRYEYNDYDQLTRVISPAQEITNYHYDIFGKLTEVISPHGEKWRYDYDNCGLLRRLDEPSGRYTEYRYNSRGEVLRKTDSAGREWRYSYSEDNARVEIQQPGGQRTVIHRDCLGRIQSVTDATGRITRYKHSASHASPQGSVTEVILPDGTRQQTEYNSERLAVRVTDGEGKVSQFHYGPLDLLLGQTRPDGQRVQYQYDRLMRLTGVINAGGERYQLIRDAVGRVREEIDFTGRRQHYWYDAAGRLKGKRTGRQVTTYHYDTDDHLLREQSWLTGEHQSRLQGETQYVYDQKGQLTSARNADACVEFGYDDARQLIAETINGKTTHYQYDRHGGELLEEQREGLALTLAYGPEGLLQQLQVNQSAPLSFAYDALGRECVRRSRSGFVQAKNYNAAGLLRSQAAGSNAASLLAQLADNLPVPLASGVVNRSWEYDKAFNVTAVDDSRWGQERYSYNANDQIILAQTKGLYGKSRRFAYDVNLNLNEQKDVLAKIPSTVSDARSEYHAGRVVRRGNCHYRYNEYGQLTEKRELKAGFRPQVWKYRWNGNGRLAELLTPGQVCWRYACDAFGRRIRKLRVVTDTGGAAKQQTDQIIGYEYQWQGDQLTEETPLYADGTAGSAAAIHWLYRPGDITPFARYENGRLHYVVADHLGTPRELLSEQGRLAWAGKTDVWGRIKVWRKAANDEDNPECRIRFPGQYEDEESGLHYNRFRYYYPETAQYISADPLGLAGGIRPYGYVHNPLGWVDPLGLANYQGLKPENGYLRGKRHGIKLHDNCNGLMIPDTLLEI